MKLKINLSLNLNQIEKPVTQSPIQLEELFTVIKEPAQGARIVFVGTIRNQNFGKKVIAVSYDIYEALAKTVFNKICEEAAANWGPHLSCAIVHRTGRLQVGEISVAVVVGAPHRDEAYQSSRYIIEAIKHQAPIWKKEYYSDGETEWLDGHALCGAPSPQINNL